MAVGGSLELNSVSFKHGEVVVLHEQSATTAAGGTLLVTGANGVGKSTLLFLCAGLVSPHSGAVLLGGKPAIGRHPSAMMRDGIRRGFVFQDGGLVSNLSALANVTLALRYHADVLELSDALINERARFCLGAVGVESPDIHALPGRLSFGVRKRVAFARAMALEPNFAFFDDPDAGLDDENCQVVHDILVSYRDDTAVTMVVATNHRALIERLAVPVTELANGELVPLRSGTTARCSRW